MEYIVFRIMRLMDREISIYKNLYSCVVKLQKYIMNSNVLDLLVVMVEQKELINEITLVENEILEEINELAIMMGMHVEDNSVVTMCDLINLLQNKYDKITRMLKIRSRAITLLLNKTKAINIQNIEQLRICKELWKEHPPLDQVWKEFEPQWEACLAGELVEEGQEFSK